MVYQLQPKFYVSSSFPVTNKGTAIPPWIHDYGTPDYGFSGPSSWYKTPGNEDMSYYYNLVNNDKMFLQYGQNAQMWASARFFIEQVKIKNEVNESNGDISADVEILPQVFAGRKSEYAASVGYNVNYSVVMAGQEVYTFTGKTIDEFTQGQKPMISQHIRVKPQDTYTGAAFHVTIKYPNHEFEDNTTVVGFGIYNPTPPTYRPFAIRKSGNWKDLNNNNGFIRIRKTNNWTDKSQENSNTIRNANTGHNRVRKNGKWLQAPPMKGANANV